MLPIDGEGDAPLPDELVQDTPADGTSDKASGSSGNEEETAADAGDDAGEGEGENQDQDEGQQPRKRPSGAQRLKRQNEILRAELAERDRRLDALERRNGAGGGNQAGEDDGDKAPREEDFSNYFEYERALAAHSAVKAARDAVRSEFEKRENTDRAKNEGEARREQVIAYEERLDEARERIADFDQKMGEMNGTQVRNEVIAEIMSSDKGPLIAYHLANNPEKLRELNGMTSRELTREVGRLEGSLRWPASNKLTKTPAPPSKLKGGAAPTVNPSEMSQKDYEAWRAKGGGK